jgi:hypothetical protein
MKGGREPVAAGGEDMTVVFHDGITNDGVCCSRASRTATLAVSQSLVDLRCQ